MGRRLEWNSRQLASAIVGVASFCGALAITGGAGPGLDPDSMAYVGAATSFAHGGTLRVPSSRWESPDSTVALTVWPPAFPIAMGAVQTLGASPLNSARIVNAIAAGITAATTLALLASVIPLAAAFAGTIVMLLTPSFIGVHLSVLSEPLCLAFLTLTLFGMARRRPHVTGLAAAGAVMTRYAGISAAAAAGVWFLFATREPLSVRMKNSVAAAGPSVILFIAWMIRNSREKVVQSGIAVSYHGGIGSALRQGLSTTVDWLAPSVSGAARTNIAAIIALALLGSILRGSQTHAGAKPRGDANQQTLLLSTLLLLAGYLLVVLCSRLFVGGSIALDWRILSPAFLLIEIAAAVGVTAALRNSRPLLRLVALLAVLAWIGASIAAEEPVVADAITDGNDFAASDWRESPTLAWVRDSARARPLYTNWPAAIYFHSGRASYDIPNSANPDTLRLFGKIVASRDGAFAAFDTYNPDYPPSDSIARIAGLVELERFADGKVFVRR